MIRLNHSDSQQNSVNLQENPGNAINIGDLYRNHLASFHVHVTARTKNEAIMCQVQREFGGNELHRTSMHPSLQDILSAVDVLKKGLEKEGYLCITDFDHRLNPVSKDGREPVVTRRNRSSLSKSRVRSSLYS